MKKQEHIQLISLKETAARVGRSRWWIRHEVNAGRFPKPINIGYRNTMFVEAEVDAYLSNLIAQRDRAA